MRLRTLRGGLREGLQLLEIDNGAFRTALLPGRGMGVWKCYHAGETLGWNSPVRGPVHPAYVPVTEPSGLGWLDGFDELLVRCGLSSFGAPDHNAQGQLLWPLHGRIANLPAHWLSVSVDRQTGEIEVIGVVDETRFHFQKLRLTSTLRTLPGEPGVRIHDVVENLSANPAQMQLLYHVNLGQPLLEPGSRVVVPAAEVSPRDTVATTNLAGWETYGPPTPGSTESAYFFQLRGDSNGDTRVLLKNAGGDRGASLGFNLRQMPYFTLWKNTPGEADGYVTGLEPGTGFPNTRTHEEAQHRVVELPPGGRAEFDLSLTSHADAAAVAEAEQAVAELSEPGPLRIHPQPKPGWTVG
ncbi:MAG: aldose 1-epimerase family protein [Planctomycetia bacterium]|nr:aldose 1-epimerase family protein [Planctomycetia bacterium]